MLLSGLTAVADQDDDVAGRSPQPEPPSDLRCCSSPWLQSFHVISVVELLPAQRAPTWANDLVAVASTARLSIDTPGNPVTGVSRKSDAILANLRPGLENLGYQVESDKSMAGKITRPVLFGNDGKAEVSHDIDAFHDDLGIAFEVEAGRGASNGADYRDIVHTSLLLDAKYLALFMPISYRYQLKGKPQVTSAYLNTERQLNAIYASQRLQLLSTASSLSGTDTPLSVQPMRSQAVLPDPFAASMFR